MKLFAHQETTAAFYVKTPRAFNTSSPGTGKTISSIEGFKRSRKPGDKLLVLAPLSILQPSWGKDIEKFCPTWGYGIAHGTPAKRAKIIRGNYDVVVTNHDAVNWIAKDLSAIEGFTHIVIDEFTAFKNRTTGRSKALKKITDIIPSVWMLSGTPNSNSNLDLWFPSLLLDKGERLGKRFFEFRSAVCLPQQVGPDPQHVQWLDKPGAEFDIADRLKDITIRFQAEDCIDLPEHRVQDVLIDMPKWLNTQYRDLLRHDVLETASGDITSFHAGARVRKLLQLLSGAVYDGEGGILKIHVERYNLVMDLIEARDQVVVAFNYKHERDQLIACAKARKISYGVIDGDANIHQRNRAVEDFQHGAIKVIFAHPQSAGHGLTLTNGVATIWCSPTYNAEHYQQFNCRIYRAGQTKKTETIRIAYNDSKEIEVYNKLDGKVTRMDDLLELFQQFTEVA